MEAGSLKKIENFEVAKKLVFFCFNNENPIFIENYGENIDSGNIKLNEEVFDGLSEGEIEEIKKYFRLLKEYLKSPIFTDVFVDHLDRRTWEKKYKNLMSEDILNYYESNRLGLNNCNHAVGYLDVLIEDIKNEKIKDKLIETKKEIPPELLSQEKSGLFYGGLNNEQKVSIMNRFSEILKKVLQILEK